jgi:hypothetical protein
MTEEEATALGKRLAACRHFRPMPGLKDMQGRTWDDSLLWRWNPEVDVPDLRQPASMGILLALVREAWGQATLSPVSRGRRLWCLADFGTTALQGETEVELLVVALEAAP